jgi:alkaline phosphatase D
MCAVKVDVSGLEPASTYFYQFSACGLNSIPGRTKTLPMRDADVSELRVAAFSCTDYARGHLYAYDLLFRMYEDIDVGLHLGDFIYEYLPPPEERDYYANGDVAEPDVPKLLTLDDYRQRYSWYRRNQALIDASRAFPWIVVPDDHEVANNSWRDGAEGDAHVDETDGPWPTRLGAALRAYFEWLPIRQEETGSYKIYRQFTWGKLLDLWMLDTRYDGRDEQVGDSPSITDDPFGYQQWVSKAFQNSIMSDVQMNWLTTGLATSDRVWKVLGNQVPFTDTKDPITDGGSIAWQDDQWCGYKRSQAQVLDAIRNVSDVVILTGDTHIPYILETFQNPDKDGEPYAVEFCTPSITSNTHGESMIRFENATPSDVLDYTEMIIATNPWMFDVEMLQHGFVSVTFSADKVRSIYYGVGDVVAPPPYETEVYRDFTACRGRSRVYRTPDAPC